jgi:hypothetical protein
MVSWMTEKSHNVLNSRRPVREKTHDKTQVTRRCHYNHTTNNNGSDETDSKEIYRRKGATQELGNKGSEESHAKCGRRQETPSIPSRNCRGKSSAR